MENSFLELLSKRHSFYNINSNLPLSEDEISSLIFEAVKLYPSPFNSQSSRLLVLFADKHRHFWHIVEQKLLVSSPSSKEIAIKQRMLSFAQGAGTILYFIDKDIIREQEKEMPLYAANFKNWAYQSSAMLQFMIWSTLANKDIGASLQHYNPLIDTLVQKEFVISDSWELVAQMPFGGINSIPQPHTFEDIANKIIIQK